MQFDLPSQRGTRLRKNKSQWLKIEIELNKLDDIFLVNGNSLYTKGISNSDLEIAPNSYYMVINTGKDLIRINFNQDISNHEIIYDPYKNITYDLNTRKYCGQPSRRLIISVNGDCFVCCCAYKEPKELYLGNIKEKSLKATSTQWIKTFLVIPAKLVLDSPHESGDRGAEMTAIIKLTKNRSIWVK